MRLAKIIDIYNKSEHFFVGTYEQKKREDMPIEFVENQKGHF